jgi:hypothetical protein
MEVDLDQCIDNVPAAIVPRLIYIHVGAIAIENVSPRGLAGCYHH